jgi:hypothetical protein
MGNKFPDVCRKNEKPAILEPRLSFLQQSEEGIGHIKNGDKDENKSKNPGSDKVSAYRKQLFHNLIV